MRDLPRAMNDEIPLANSVIGKRGVLLKLYTKFLESPHFPGWFGKHRDRAKKLLDRKINKMIRKIPFTKWVEGRPVREGVQMYNAIHKYLNANYQSPKRMFCVFVCLFVSFVFVLCSVNIWKI